jgi:hypothetical protein
MSLLNLSQLVVASVTVLLFLFSELLLLYIIRQSCQRRRWPSFHLFICLFPAYGMREL